MERVSQEGGLSVAARRFVKAAAFVCVVALSVLICKDRAMAKLLSVGDTAPDFTLENHAGKPVSLKDYRGKKNLVVYFYPKDETPVCTAEACEFRDQYEDFLAAGAEVIGISSDSAASHKRFAEKRKLPFVLLSDPDGKIKAAYGVGDGLFGLMPGRVTYVVDKQGKIRHAFEGALRAKKHVDEALAVIKKLP